jgi:hypothetical protein
MNSKQRCACIICGTERHPSQSWFLLMESRWQDRLKILQWDDRLAKQKGMHPACSANHVQELVIHWMTTGSMDYPFARVSPESPKLSWRKLIEAPPEANLNPEQVIGELAVHRESMRRVLRDSPQSLSEILSALMEALEGNSPMADPDLEESEDLVLEGWREV